MDPGTGRPHPTPSGCLYAAHGAFMVLAGAAVALMCWLIPMLLAKVLASDVIDPADVSATAKWVIGHRALMPLLALPAIALGVLVLARVRPRPLWVALGALAMLGPAALLIYVFIATIGLLYQPQDLLT
jgi:hypothetical protein